MDSQAACAKIPYPSKKEADKDAKIIISRAKHFSKKTKKAGNKYTKQYSYECRYCGFWHLTSQKQNRKY